MDKSTIMGLIRHVLTFGGGFMASAGWVSASNIEAGIGAVITLVGIIWSAMQKKGKAA